jgi:HSP20 family protein
MGITDKLAALLPRPGQDERGEARTSRADALALHDDFDRWLQRFMQDPFGEPGAGQGPWRPSAELRETDDAVEVRAEVPGLDPEDIELTISPGALTIRGERREERKDKKRGSVEWRYGSFVESVALPPGVDVDRAEARLRNGVLVARFPKVQARSAARRIPVKALTA